MSQHDMNIANQGFPATRADINSALGALVSNSSGATAPSTTVAYQMWYDTTDNLLKMRNADNDAWITLAYFNQTDDEWEVRSAVVQAVDAAGLLLKTDDGTTRIEIQDDGDVSIDSGTLFVDAASNRVGIGTTSPIGNLHVYTDASGATAADGAGDEFVLENSGNCGLTIFTPNTYTASVFFGDPNDSTVGRIQYNHTNDYMRFYTSGSEAMRINSAGQALISQTSSTVGARSAQLIVERDAATDCIAAYYPTTSSTGSIYRGLSDVGGSETIKFIVRTDGDVQSATNSYGAISDQVLKQDIVDASSQWDDIKALQVKKYRFTNLVEQDGDDAPVHLGVIAQDLEASGMSGLVSENETLYWEEGDELPEGVSVGDVKDQGYKTVKYSILYMKAVKALQEAMERIETLESKVAALEAN